MAEYLATGTIVTSDQAEEWDWSGSAPLAGKASLSEVLTAYQQWYRAIGEVLDEVMEELGTPGEVRRQCRVAVRLGYETALLRMAKRFEVTRQELEEQLAEQQARLEHQALHDPLTGLAHRVLLRDRLEHSIQAAAFRSTVPAVLFMDLDYFKSVNDASGHSVGDQVLVEVAERLKGISRPNDTIARLGGDEFVVLCEDLADPLPEAKALAQRITACLASPFSTAERGVYIAASIGIAPSVAGVDAEALLARADLAMYRAKSLGRGRIEVYDPSFDRQVTRSAEMSTAMNRALEEKRFYLAYQPIVNLNGRRMVGREALLRWTDPTFGSVAPSEFVPLAEATGLIVKIGSWVLRQACRDCTAWRASADSGVGVAVNVSGRQLEGGQFEKEVAAALDDSGLAPEALTLEMTETQLIAGRTEARTVLKRISSTGVRIAIDDFGTGYSSLSWLARLPVDVIKVDRSFIASLGLIDRESAIVGAMMHLAHTLGLGVVAEGVETESQLALLTGLACDEAQGYLLGYPKPLVDQFPRRS
jgi:diguanylate cyclase (GGDEF)-like protein